MSWAGLMISVLMALSFESEPALTAELHCPARDAPGRVVCELSMVLPAPGARLVWADALVVRTPVFVEALRTRTTADVPERDTRTLKLSIAFVASDPGRGELSIRARAVVCVGDASGDGGGVKRARRCVTASREVSAEVVVGNTAS